MIEVKHISKYFGNLKAVDDVSFSVKKGEIVGFLGPNGAGKTTTMRMITGFFPPDSGNIYIDEVNVVDDPVNAKKHIGYLPENAPLYEDMTVYEYLNFIAEVRNITDKEKRIRDTIEMVGLAKMFKRFIYELSKGYHQRVGLAQAMLSEPEFLILDEPTTGLDPNQILEIREVIKKLGEEKTIILSTHILQEAEALASKIIIIDKAKIVAQGTKEEVKNLVHSTHTIYVAYKGDDKFQDTLKALEGINNIKTIYTDNNVKKIELFTNRDLREEIFKKAVENNVILLELSKKEASLEDVFARITKKEVENDK